MTTPDDAGQTLSHPDSASDATAPRGPMAPPTVDMKTSHEVRAWISRLEQDEQTVGRRNKFLAVALAIGVVLLIVAITYVHRATVGTYAVLDNVMISRHEANQGRLEISFQVTSPGKVFYRRTSGRVETQVVDYFHTTGRIERSWAWVYEPGRPIDVTLWSRRGPFLASQTESFPTADRGDIVVLIDTTGSMNASLAELKEKCDVFSRQLRKQSLEHRFALVGFGDTAEGLWLDSSGFTSDVDRFRRQVEDVQRFDGGDLAESALDAIEEALALPLDDGAIRRFYLVTDAKFHEPSRSGATGADLAARLAEQRVLLEVFSSPKFESDYQPLLGSSGRFQEIENFGRVLSEGRILED